MKLLRPIRSRAHRFGGSHAQRDLLDRPILMLARGQHTFAFDDIRG